MKRRFFLAGLTFVALAEFGYAQHIGQSSAQYNGSVYHLGGNVGIGTATPSFSLTIRKDAPGSEGAVLNLVNSQYANSTGSSSAIRFQTGVDYRFAKISAIQRETGVTDRLVFGMVNYNDIYTEILTLKENGNVGIGTPVPKLKLDVKSSVIGYPLKSGTAQLFGSYRIGSTQTDVVLDFGINGGDDASSWIQATYSTDLSRAYNLLINPNGGNVCIGTIESFGYKLAVNGTIGAKEVKVENTSAWPDFVFKPNYILRPLNEVEQFVKTNNHLPEMPSEKEVKENGVVLGEMNAKLLQKIEELTLYLIEQSKRMEEQQKVNEKQSQLINELERKLEAIASKK